MAEIFETIITAALAFGFGALFAERKFLKENEENKPEEEAFFYSGFAEKKIETAESGSPTVARQMINIMNYNGECQTEESYE